MFPASKKVPSKNCGSIFKGTMTGLSPASRRKRDYQSYRRLKGAQADSQTACLTYGWQISASFEDFLRAPSQISVCSKHCLNNQDFTSQISVWILCVRLCKKCSSHHSEIRFVIRISNSRRSNNEIRMTIFWMVAATFLSQSFDVFSRIFEM